MNKLMRLAGEFNPDLKIDFEFDNSEKYNRLLKNTLEDDPMVERLVKDIDGEILK
jgi:hypothetical protein